MVVLPVFEFLVGLFISWVRERLLANCLFMLVFVTQAYIEVAHDKNTRSAIASDFTNLILKYFSGSFQVSWRRPVDIYYE